MIKALMQEWLLIRRNTTLWGIVGVLVLLIIGASLNGLWRAGQLTSITEGLNTEEMATQKALKGTVERWEQNPSDDMPAVTSPGAVGLSILSHYSVLPSRALAPLAAGQSDVQPNYYRVDGHSAHTFMDKSETANPLNVLSGSFDVAFVIVFLLPVFIIALTFDLLSKEKEAGILAMILAHGQSLQRIVLSKSYSLALILFTVIVGVGFLSLLIVGADLTLSTTWMDFGLWLMIVALYGFFWFGLALLVNSFAMSSVANGVILANLWLVFVVVVPAVVNVTATTIYPAPSRVELTTEMREASSKAEKEAAEAREAYFFDHPDLSDAGASDDFFLQVLATEAAVERSVAHLVEAFDVQAEKREAMVSMLQFLSPAHQKPQPNGQRCALPQLRWPEPAKRNHRWHQHPTNLDDQRNTPHALQRLLFLPSKTPPAFLSSARLEMGPGK